VGASRPAGLKIKQASLPAVPEMYTGISPNGQDLPDQQVFDE